MKILCPTDFSACANTALEYAVQLCNRLGAELHLLSAYSSSGDRISRFPTVDVARIKVEQQLEQLVAGIVPLLTTDHTPVTRVMEDRPVAAIRRYVDYKEIDLVVMGTHGDTVLRNVLFGSNALKAISKSRVPVLVVPDVENAAFLDRRFVLALDNRWLEELDGFELLKRLSKAYRRPFDILHVVETSERGEAPVDPYVRTLLGAAMGEVILLAGNDPVEQIRFYAEHNQVGILAMIRHRHNFFEKLILKDHTDAELANTRVPLLVIPE